jgi:integrase
MATVFRRRMKFRDKDGRLITGKTSTYYARFSVHGQDHCISTGKTTEKEARQDLKRLVGLHRGEARIEDQFRILRELLQAPPPRDQAAEDRLAARRSLLANHIEPLLLEMLEGLPEAEREARRRQLARRLLSGQQRKLRLTEGWKGWLASPNKKRTPKGSTLSGYESIWKRFTSWANTQAVEHLHDVLEKHAHDYAKDLWASKVSPSTFNAHVKFLAGAFALLEAEAGLTENVWRKITRKDKATDQGRRNLTEEELKTVFTRASGPQRVMLALGLFTGLRLGDVVNLRWEQIDRDPFKGEAKPGFIVVQPMKTSRLGKRVELPIHAALRQVLNEYRATASCEYLFPRERELYAQNAANVSKPIQELFESCGITTTEEPANGERRRAIVRVGFHSLRHSFVSLCAKGGAPQHVVQRLVGHGSPAMTLHYTHLDDQQKQSAVAALPGLGVHGYLTDSGLDTAMKGDITKLPE